MNKLAKILALTTTLAIALPVLAQQKRVSPHETISARIGGKLVTITYGRPYSKDPKGGAIREIWGKLVPWDAAWRMGSDEATTLVTQSALAFGGTTIPAGAYTLYLVPSEKGASKLAISSAIGGWGIPVDDQHDVARVDLKKEPLDPQVDQFTMGIERSGSGGVIKIMWEKTQFSAPFTLAK